MLKNLARIVVAMAFLTGAATAEGAAETGWVKAFVEKSERILSQDGPDAARRLQAVYKRYFDIGGLAARIAPERLWKQADSVQRRRFVAIVSCRLAVESVKRAKSETPLSWKVVGSRPAASGQTAAVRFILAENRQKTVLFDVVQSRSGLRVVDISSEGGRLSARFASQIARESRNLVDPPDVERWLNAFDCRA
ncbi:ABC transporter substrate-binding protein [Aurantimonas marianensis]|uniref:ABC transporter substrate-binding protein n=1 Tax=Aurantimonas marianensis TaxID=2920428 RepID=A0A9X2H7H9_9HYPH|nr:ABC transporter substrate-binding protein [Aurantimonas marianensis]MCP3056827.1 ABC transporter substrate-binding protein [Aurantimonas marianensis]